MCFTLIKASLDLAPPLRFAGLRTLVAGLALLGLTVARHEPLLPSRRVWLPLGGLALIATTFAYGAMFLSPGRTGAGIASVLGNAQPLVTVGLATVFLGERLTRGKAIALGLGVGGVVSIAYPALSGPGAYGMSGALLALAVSIGSAGGGILIKRMGHLPSLLAVTAWSRLLGSLCHCCSPSGSRSAMRRPPGTSRLLGCYSFWRGSGPHARPSYGIDLSSARTWVS